MVWETMPTTWNKDPRSRYKLEENSLNVSNFIILSLSVRWRNDSEYHLKLHHHGFSSSSHNLARPRPPIAAVLRWGSRLRRAFDCGPIVRSEQSYCYSISKHNHDAPYHSTKPTKSTRLLLLSVLRLLECRQSENSRSAFLTKSLQ